MPIGAILFDLDNTLILEDDATEEALRRTSELAARRSEEHTSELQSPCNLVCRLLLEKKNFNFASGMLGSTLQEYSVPLTTMCAVSFEVDPIKMTIGFAGEVNGLPISSTFPILCRSST